MNPIRGATGAARGPNPGKTPRMAARRSCRCRVLFFKIKVRPRPCRSYPIWRPCTEPNTPMLNQRPTKGEFFILQDFWPVLKIFQYLGLFPCQKITDENGAIQLQPMKLWKSIMAAFIWFLIILLPISGNNLLV